MVQIDTSLLIWFLGIVFVVIGVLLWDKFKKNDKEIKNKQNKETCIVTHKGINNSIKDIQKNIGILINSYAKNEFANIRQSPRQLNSEGNIVFNHSGIQSLIDDNKKLLFDEIDKINPQNYYDVEFQVEKIINIINTDANAEAIKSCAEKVNLSIEVLLFIGSVYLSNLYLKEHQELVKEQDKKDKQQK